jgi:uncharacterized protein YegP (UPF0339 family)
MKPQSTKIGFYIYRAKDGFRWRCIHHNGNIIAESGEAYKSKHSLKRTLDNFMMAIAQHDWNTFDQTK